MDEQIDAGFMIQALEAQRNQAQTQAAMAIARATTLLNETIALKAEIEKLKAPST